MTTKSSASSVPAQVDWRSAEYRRALILSLRDACKGLTPFLHTSKGSGSNDGEIFLDMDKPEVEQVVCVLENILLHGIKIREFQQIIPLWGLLERLEVLTNPTCIALRNAVGAVASCSAHLRNPLGKARGWIRQSLNAKNLDESVQYIVNQPTWLNKFYYPEAILRVKTDAEMLVSRFYFLWKSNNRACFCLPVLFLLLVACFFLCACVCMCDLRQFTNLSLLLCMFECSWQ